MNSTITTAPESRPVPTAESSTDAGTRPPDADPVPATDIRPPDADDVPADPQGHRWVGAATVRLDRKQANRAVLRGSVRLATQTRVDVLETYCAGCRRPFDDVAGESCAAVGDGEFLHGGPIGTRQKRKHNHNCELLGCYDPDPREMKRNGLLTG